MFDDGNTRLNYEIQNFKTEIEQLTNIEINIINYQKLNADFPGEFTNLQALLKKVSEGSQYQMILGSAYYWIDSIPESVFFASMPFGMHHEALSNWVGNGGDGRLIWDSIYLPTFPTPIRENSIFDIGIQVGLKFSDTGVLCSIHVAFCPCKAHEYR